MTNPFPDFKREMNKIKVPENKLDSSINQALRKGKRKRTIKKIPFFITAALLTFSLIVGSAFVSPTMANFMLSIPYVNSILEFMGDKGLQIASEKGLTEEINEFATDENITFIINDIYNSGNSLHISFIIQPESEHGILKLDESNPYFPFERADISVNGEYINFSSGLDIEQTSDGKYIGVLNMNPAEELPSNFNLRFHLSRIGEETGSWELEFPVKASENKKILLAKSKSYDEFTITAKSISISPADIDVSFDSTNQIVTKDDGMVEEDDHIFINLLTNDGKSLNVLDLSAHAGREDITDTSITSHHEYRFLPPENEVEYFVISPYIVPDYYSNETVSAVLELEKLPITLEQGDLGTITITRVEFQKDKTLIYHTVDSDFPYPNHLDSASISITDKNGDYIEPLGRGVTQSNSNEFVLEFEPISKKNQPITVVTHKHPMPEILHELEIKVPVNN